MVLRRWSRYCPLVVGALLCLSLLEGCLPPAGVVVVRTPPPVPVVETAPPSPDPGAVWVRGHWTWNGARYVWVPGHWEQGRPGGHYVPGRWIRRGRGWVHVPGHWRRPYY
jgi:hypothetical protein